MMPIPSPEEKLAWLHPEPATPAELAAVARLTPGDYEIGFQRTNDILDEALQVYERSSRSSMGVAGDVICGIFTAAGDLVNAATGTYLHAIIQPGFIKYIRKYYGENPGVNEGDIWVMNDALYGGIHNPDVCCLIPVFHKGQLIAWAGAANHTTETGAVEPGGMPVGARSRFEEGMNLPPLRIGQGGELKNDIVELLAAYGIRAPQMIITDMKARATAADRVRVRLIEWADKEGAAMVTGLLRKALQVAEDGARRRIAAWPDGKYRAIAFNDGFGREQGLIRSAYLTLTKQGDRLILDFTGTSPENHSSYNAHVQAAVGHMANYVYSYVFYDLPISSASFAPLEFIFPRGSALNADDRAATSNSVHICSGLHCAAANAFSKAMFATPDWTRAGAAGAMAGNGHVIAGVNQWGLPFADNLAYALNTDGHGAMAQAVGMDAYGFEWCPFGRAPNVESMENEFPILVATSQHWQDSCGHGKYRGGVGTVQIWLAHHTPEIFYLTAGDNSCIQTPQPLFGGYSPCTVPGIAVRHADLVPRMQEGGADLKLDFRHLIDTRGIGGQWEVEFNARTVRAYAKGDVVTMAFSGGGAGYGDPLEADPEWVVTDIHRGIIHPDTAARIYKVVYDPATWTPDAAQTATLRAAERKARLQRGRPYADWVRDWQTRKPPESILHAYGSWPDARPVRPVVRV